MTNPETHTINTAYGSTEIKTYDCDSCGNTVPYDETVEFTIGVRKGRACEICEDTGPVSFPEKAREHMNLYQNGDVMFGTLLWPMVGVAFALAPDSEFGRGYAVASLAAWLWIAVAVLGMVVR